MVFADTSFLYAGLVGGDEYHELAMELAEMTADRQLVTTNLVIGECWTLLNRRWGHHYALTFLEQTERAGMLDTFHLPEDQEERAFTWLRRHDERPYSFVDATSFAFMEENGISEALSFDGDFAAAGFTELRP
ncbi:MAG: type II toxin-antitoxin system VapC family toxin [Solirubrobacterales bacterium]